LPEEPATIAYTRFVLERGMAGDLLDLHVALAPCVIGYAEIGRWLDADPDTARQGNPYADWIAMYAGADYQKVAAAAASNLDALMARRGGSGRLDSLVQAFRAATELEVAFWQMGLDRA
jgi:thiaminase/transcriptional activator TenA